VIVPRPDYDIHLKLLPFKRLSESSDSRLSLRNPDPAIWVSVHNLKAIRQVAFGLCDETAASAYLPCDEYVSSKFMIS